MKKKEKLRKCAFIVNIEESVREASVPNLPGVHPRRRFFQKPESLVLHPIEETLFVRY